MKIAIDKSCGDFWTWLKISRERQLAQIWVEQLTAQQAEFTERQTMSKPTQDVCLENEVEGWFKENKYIPEKKTVKQTYKKCERVEDVLSESK